LCEDSSSPIIPCFLISFFVASSSFGSLDNLLGSIKQLSVAVAGPVPPEDLNCLHSADDYLNYTLDFIASEGASLSESSEKVSYVNELSLSS